MNRKEFLKKADRLQAEVENEQVADGHEPNFFEIISAVYERLFGESIPTFENGLSDDVKAKVLHECIFWQKKISDLTAVEFLQLQYECRFGEQLTYNFMSIRTEEHLTTALRECLKTGKPYEIPESAEKLLEQGAIF